MADPQHRIRSSTEMIDAAFQLLKRNFPPLITISAIGAIPLFLLNLSMAMSSANATPGAPWSARLGGMTIFLGFVTFVALTFTANALVRAVSDAYLGRPIDIAGSFRMSPGKFFSLWGAYLLSFIIIIVGMVLLIVPGIIATLLLFVILAVVVLEDLGPVEAVKRSVALCKDNKGRIAGFMTAVSVAMLVMLVIFGILAFTLHSLIVQQLCNTVIKIVITPLSITFVVLQYYQARIEKEGYDVELLVHSAAPAITPSIAVE